MGDEIFKLMGSVLFNPGNVFDGFGRKSDFGVVSLDFHSHLEF